MEGSKPVKPGSSACLWLGLVSVAVAFLCTEARTTPSPLLSPSNGTCKGNTKCHTGIILPIWYPEDPSMGDKIARVIVYFVALIYMFLGVSIIADRFMAAIEVITSQEREIVIKRPNGETTTTTIRVWNETVSNLTLMALGSSAPEIMLSVIEVCGHEFKSGELGPSTIVGSAAFNMFVIIGLCVSVIPQGEVRKVKHLRVFFVTAGWSIFAYIWLYMILAVFSPNEVQVWEGLVTLAFFPICVLLAWVADRRLLFYKFMHKKYRTEKHRGVIIETETERSKGIEMDGKMVNSHFMDGGATSNLIGLIESKEVDESRRDMIRILKDLKQKHPEKELDQLVEMANYYALSHQQKSRAFYRIQATRMMTGAGNILKKHVAEQAKKSASVQEVHVEEPEEYVSRIAFEPAVYQCLENCGAVILTITRKGGDINKTIYVDYKTEDGSANAGADYEFTEGMVVFKPGEMIKEISIGIIDDDIFEEDEHFFVRLSNLRVLETEDEVLSANSLPYPKAVLGFPTVATVTILDDDHSGIFTFESNSAHVSESIGIMEVKVLRTSGARGTVIVPYRTVEGLAKGGGEDFEDTYGELEFKNDETCKFVHVKIIDDEEYEKNKNFFLELAEPRMVDMSLQKALLLADDVPDRKLTSDEEEAKRIAEMGKPVLGEHSKLEVIIEESYEFKSTVDKLIKKTNLALVVGTNSWREQFMEAITVSAGDEDEDDTGEERLPSCFDYVMHFLTVFWKVLFACVPPTDYMNGWACFTISIIIIGLLTAVIGDLASHFGCTIGLKDSVTAVVFVALGTSVPDTFASKVAAVQDTYADASIGNVTGSNAVNVFLGIGMAWSVAAIYWHMKGKPFVVEAGSLAFSVTLFTIFAFLAISVLLYRRRAHIGGELGGPRGHRLATSAFLFSLWFLYILFSSLEAYCHIEGF
ncbi:sodium/calcium exchanger 3 isoform X1 [Maylandia zebra]|uniref:sodium/calcium exchanger 3 isoform X1 n=2 Tax=Maylandia zebra TaxID=106582 RepID=UPI000E3FE645|nr:sodium/calcium exchanger 3 isoform X1 [Astatotilapia calliptera]XP_026007129.1 sodium/calcium exchanger 3 isoform X1 [Astatotilapia calliptera]XP_026007130.1 sodium/calcium exchanger 3 isoform X1 [Astatotilapia calliptera]